MDRKFASELAAVLYNKCKPSDKLFLVYLNQKLILDNPHWVLVAFQFLVHLLFIDTAQVLAASVIGVFASQF